MRFNLLTIISITLFSLAIFTACERDIPICESVQFGEEFEVVPNRSYCFNDGNSFMVSRFVDNYCPCTAYCIWEGELLIELIFNEGGEFTNFTFHSSNKVVDVNPPNGWTIELAEPAGKGCVEITNAHLIVTQ